MNGKCDICGGAVDFNGGGAALMMAFCYDHTTTMTNNAFCAECYKMFVEKPLMVLSEKAGLKIPLPEPTKEDKP